MHSDAFAADDFENNVTKDEITHDEQFPKLSQCYQLHSKAIPSFIEIYHSFIEILSKSNAADLLYVGNR